MAQSDYSKYQQGVIKRYYENLDGITLQKIQELVTELYLADSDKKKQRLWERVHKTLIQMKIKPGLIEHIMAKQDVKVLAENVQDWVKAAR